MHSQFAEWFQSANLPQTDDALQKRWAGIDAFEFNAQDVVALVELFFGNFENKDSFLDKFRKSFQDADSSFRMKENNLELSILAGAELVDIMDRGSNDDGDFAALALVSNAAQNLRYAPCVTQIPEYAVHYIAKRSLKRGKLSNQEKEGLDEPAIKLKQLRKDLDLLGEETNALWWIFGETSRDTNFRWTKLGVSQTTILAGKELADLTRLMPGHSSSAALLDRAVRCARPNPPTHVVPADAIAELPLEWRQQFIKTNFSTELSTLTPITHGIKLSIDHADGETWAKSFERLTKIKKGSKIFPHLLSYQVFLESLVTRLRKEL